MNAVVSTTPVVTLTRTINVWPLGLPVPEQGGIYIGITRGEPGQPEQHNFMATKDTKRVAYGNHGKRIPGADFTNDGLANHKALIAHGGSPIAQACAEFTDLGFSDFHLPSQAQMALAVINGREHLTKDSWYWTSTQYSPYLAWIQYSVGYQLFHHKGLEFLARPVRSIPV